MYKHLSKTKFKSFENACFIIFFLTSQLAVIQKVLQEELHVLGQRHLSRAWSNT